MLHKNETFAAKVQELLQILKATLKKTIVACSRFVSEDQARLQHQADEETCEKVAAYCDEITTCVTKMETILEGLSSLENEIQNFKAKASHIH